MGVCIYHHILVMCVTHTHITYVSVSLYGGDCGRKRQTEVPTADFGRGGGGVELWSRNFGQRNPHTPPSLCSFSSL